MAKKREQADYTEDFLAFWKGYPQQKSNGVWLRPGKAEAFAVWQQMTDSQKAHAMYSVVKYKPAVKDGNYVCHARTWLSQRRYEDWDLPTEQDPPAAIAKGLLRDVNKVIEDETDLHRRRNQAVQFQAEALRRKA